MSEMKEFEEKMGKSVECVTGRLRNDPCRKSQSAYFR